MKLPRTALTLALAGFALAVGTVGAFAAEAMSTTSLNVRSGPGPGYRVVDVLHPGERVDVDRCVGSWCFVTHPGPDGWVSANYLTRGDDRWDDRPPVYVHPPYPPREYPYYRPYRPYRPYYQPYGSFCLGGKNASFCVGGY